MSARGTSYAVWSVAAVALHGGLFLGLGSVFKSHVQYAITVGESVELTLVEAAEALASDEPIAPEITPPPLPPELPPEPVIEPLPPEPEVIEPQPKSLPPPASTPPPVRRAPMNSRPKTSIHSIAKPNGLPVGGSVRGGHTQARPAYLSNPAPAYPAASKQAREQGVVLLSVSVSEQGRADSVRLVRSSGHPRLDEAARTAVQRWRFSAARIGSVAVASNVEVPVRFHLK